MRLSLIVAMAANRVIGRDNRLPWRLPADLRRFKRLTMGHHLLVGRKTFESIGRPLPGRQMVVISRRDGYAPSGVVVARSIEEAVEHARASGDDEAFVGGGARIYGDTLDRADRIYLTRLHRAYDGDTHMPRWDESAWRLTFRVDREPDAKNPVPYSFLVYDRVRT